MLHQPEQQQHRVMIGMGTAGQRSLLDPLVLVPNAFASLHL
jgi:hypothetical protein